MGCISSSEAYEAMIKCADFKLWMAQFETIGLYESDIKRLFQVFEIIDQDHSNNIGLPELLAHIDLPRTEFTEKIFSLFDNDQSGAIDFREFVLSVWNYCTLSKVNLDLFAFDLYDSDSSGALGPAEILGLIQDIFGKQEMKSNVHAKAVIAELNTYEGRRQQFTSQRFHHFMLSHQAMIFPAFKIQSALQQKVLGSSYWQRKMEQRQKYSKGEYIPIKQFLAEKRNSQTIENDSPSPNKALNGSKASMNSQLSSTSLQQKPSSGSFGRSAKMRFHAGVKGVSGFFSGSGKHQQAQSPNKNKVHSSGSGGVLLTGEGFSNRPSPSRLNHHGRSDPGQRSTGHTPEVVVEISGAPSAASSLASPRHSPHRHHAYSPGHRHHHHHHGGSDHDVAERGKGADSNLEVEDLEDQDQEQSQRSLHSAASHSTHSTHNALSPRSTHNTHHHSHGSSHSTHNAQRAHSTHSGTHSTHSVHGSHHHQPHHPDPIVKHYAVVEVGDDVSALPGSFPQRGRAATNISASSAAQIAGHLKKRHMSVT